MMFVGSNGHRVRFYTWQNFQHAIIKFSRPKLKFVLIMKTNVKII